MVAIQKGGAGGNRANVGITTPPSKGGKQVAATLSKISDSYALMFPAALPVRSIVVASGADNLWRYGVIIHARFAGKKQKKTQPKDFDYYIHWQGMDRRLDCWLPSSRVKALDEPLPPGTTIIKTPPHKHDDHAGMDEEYLREHEENTKIKTIKRLQMGKYVVENWYFSPYPREYQNRNVLYICEFCLSFFRFEQELTWHMAKCDSWHPPGNEIYRDVNIAMFEMDGAYSKVYCENLCYLSKLFLDHKTLRHPVNLFLFYVMAEISPQGYHITGYFSKEKYSRNNVSCILTLPQHQRKGYGKFLINFSYALSEIEGKSGTPERPLSDLGRATYMSCWIEKILTFLANAKGSVSIQEISDATRIDGADIVSCMNEVGALKVSESGKAVIVLPTKCVASMKKLAGKPARGVKMELLRWVPYDPYMRLSECRIVQV